ncbi:pimeloyl-ACP methyl ester carboxylesterase [Rhodobacter sp. JA431]|uniref:alpha/beta fold hydrolase n=1 Tax=Rhodobacter sp. JA431 TaxID=570013 RepID=UPI000BCCF637|nr:alpha/beta hydrolase [Rhodobacter sp. JA431]SOB91156.1 pimeloyl-ACP methyl ester carboxylesterase [Rhodobacter sp. JA431]
MARATRLGHEINWQEIGQGERPALAIHCTLGAASLWGPVLDPLADVLTTTVFDQPGHGHSGPWEAAGAEPGAYQRLVTQLAAGFITRPVDLIGHSFGASVALRIAVGAPEAVRSLTLIEPVLFKSVEGSAEWRDLRASQDNFEAMIDGGDYETAAKGFMRDWGAGVPWEALPEHQRARFCAQMPMVRNISSANFEDPGQIWRADGIEGIDAPVMLIHGDQSPPIVAKVCAAIAERLADVGTACIPGGGHMLPVTHAPQVTDLLAMNLERS